MACRADDLVVSKLDLEPSTAVVILQLISYGPLKAGLGDGWGSEAVQQKQGQNSKGGHWQFTPTPNLTVALLFQKKLPVCDESDWRSSVENRAKL